MPEIDTTQLASDIINAIGENVIKGSKTLVSYQNVDAEMLVDFTLLVAKKINNNEITDAEARNLLRQRERIEAVNIIAEDIIRQSTLAKTLAAVMKVVETAINTATGLSLKLFA
jgi:hypothetical protein